MKVNPKASPSQLAEQIGSLIASAFVRVEHAAVMDQGELTEEWRCYIRRAQQHNGFVGDSVPDLLARVVAKYNIEIEGLDAEAVTKYRKELVG